MVIRKCGGTISGGTLMQTTVWEPLVMQFIAGELIHDAKDVSDICRGTLKRVLHQFRSLQQTDAS